jgi:molybdate transport system regulatory protein
MKQGARNAITATVKSIKTGDVMSLIKFDNVSAAEMASVITTESVEDMNLQPGDKVQLFIKAVHVLPVRE